MKKTAKRFAAGLAFSMLVMGTVGCSTGTNVNVTQDLDGAGITTVDIKSPSTKVLLTAADGDQVKVALTGKFSGDDEEKDKLLSAALEGSTLKVEVQPAGSRGWKINEMQLEVQVPKKMYDAIQVETSGGDITLDEFESKKLDLNASSGDVKVEGFKGHEFEIETSSGDMDLQKMTGSGSVKASSGDVVLGLDVMDKPMNVETSSGELKVQVPAAAKFRLEAETSWEDAKIDAPLTIEKQEGEVVEGAVNGAGADTALMKVKTSSGKFELTSSGK